MGTYKIRDLETLTGIKAHTIRIWEQRYGILRPERTDTKIRQYDDHDVRLLLGVSILNKNGIKISKIADMPEREILSRIDEMNSQQDDSQAQEKLLMALINLDEPLFASTLDLLIKQQGLLKAYTSTLLDFLERIGVMWLVGTINPAQEHFVSNLIRQKLMVAIDQLSLERKGEKVLLYLPEHELHELSLLVYHYALRNAGYQTYYLGQSVPYDSLIRSIEMINPSILVSSWITSVDPQFMKAYFERLGKEVKAELKIGGAQVHAHAAHLPKDIQIIHAIEDLLPR